MMKVVGIEIDKPLWSKTTQWKKENNYPEYQCVRVKMQKQEGDENIWLPTYQELLEIAILLGKAEAINAMQRKAWAEERRNKNQEPEPLTETIQVEEEKIADNMQMAQNLSRFIDTQGERK